MANTSLIVLHAITRCTETHSKSLIGLYTHPLLPWLQSNLEVQATRVVLVAMHRGMTVQLLPTVQHLMHLYLLANQLT